MKLKDLLDLIEDPFYLHVVDPAPGCNDPKIKAINEGGHLYEPSEILAGEDGLPKDFLDWEITIQPWDIETLSMMMRARRLGYKNPRILRKAVECLAAEEELL